MSAPEPIVLLAGATGLVGGLALELLQRSPFFRRVVVLGRRKLDEASHRVRQEIVADFASLAERPALSAMAAVCAIGTTRRAAGSDEAFIAVDLDAAVSFARYARRSGAHTFVLVSSVGANPKSRNLYLRTKGEAETEIANLGFQRFVALRPGLLIGPRAERRSGEAFAQAVVPLLNPFLFGRLRAYRSISAKKVAAAAVAAAEGKAAGTFAWENDAIIRQGTPVLTTLGTNG